MFILVTSEPAPSTGPAQVERTIPCLHLREVTETVGRDPQATPAGPCLQQRQEPGSAWGRARAGQVGRLGETSGVSALGRVWLEGLQAQALTATVGPPPG